MRVTLISTVTVASSASVPSVQSTVLPDRKQLPWVVVAETNVTPAGSVSLNATPLVSEGRRCAP